MVSLKELVLAGAIALGSAIGYSAEPTGIDPKVAYDAIYGDKEKKAQASSKPEDKFEFGKFLYEESKSKDKAQLEELLEDKAIEFLDASRKVEAYPVIVAIHKDDAQDFPDKKVDYQQKVLKVLDQYKNNLPYGEARKSVDMQIAAETVVLANYFMDDEKYGDAELYFRDAGFKASSAQMKDAQKLADEGQVTARKLREEQGNIALAVQRADKGDKQASLTVGKYHLSKGEMEKAEQYLRKSEDKKYVGFLDALKTSGAESVKETPRGVSEADVKRFEDSVKLKDNTKIYDALQKLEIEPSIRFDCQVAEAMIDKSRTENLEKKLAEIAIQLPDLMKTAKTGQINANNHMIIATQYKELGDETLANKRKIFCLEKAVNEFAIVANASTDNLAKLTAKGLQDKLTAQLAELGKQVTIDVPAIAQGKFWDFETDENCLDFTKNWYTFENKDKPNFGWTKKGEMWYVCDGFEVKNGKLLSKGLSQLFFLRVPKEYTVKIVSENGFAVRINSNLEPFSRQTPSGQSFWLVNGNLVYGEKKESWIEKSIISLSSKRNKCTITKNEKLLSLFVGDSKRYETSLLPEKPNTLAISIDDTIFYEEIGISNN